MIELRELRHLVALCEHRHFGRASSALGISQPALSKSIQRLERSLGAPLVDRSAAGVFPTPLGQEVLRRARRLLDEAGELEREVELICGLRRGELVVGVGPAMSESRLVDVIARQVTGPAAVRLQIRVDHWSQLSEWLLQRKLDLFIADITEARGDDRFTCRPLPREEIVWFCRSGHSLAGRRVGRGDLLRFPLATPRMPQWARDWFQDAADPAGVAAAGSLVECENYALLKRLVLSSDMVSAAPASSLVRELEDRRLVRIQLRAPRLFTEAGVVSLRGRTLSPLAQAVVDGVLREAQAWSA